MAFAYPRNGSSAACSTPSTNPSGWAFSQVLSTLLERPHNRVQQSRVQASGLVAGQIDHDRDRSVDPDPRRPPNVLIDSQGLDVLQPGGSLVRAQASTSTASQQVCQSTPSCRASADTVVSSELSALVAQATARVVSTIRDGAISCASVKVSVGHSGSGLRVLALPGWSCRT
jgi:hypothetical protein